MDYIGQSRLHYDIVEKLGEGGMGVVYKAFDTKLKRDVAIKFLPGRFASDEDIRKRFHIEAQAVATLNHPNIATIFAIEELTNDIGQNEIFFVMEYIDGVELRKRVAKRDLDVSEATNIAYQLVEGLSAAHEQGITHRDIKPANIMITNKGRVKLMDFGLAKIGEGIHLTKANTTLGTVAYMSPEQAQGDPADLRSDVWSLGVVLYEMLTGRLPFKGKNTYEIMNAIIHEEHIPVDELNGWVPPNLKEIVEQALQKDPDERYQSAQELAIDLHAYVHGLDRTNLADIKPFRPVETSRVQEATPSSYNPPSESQKSIQSSSIIELMTRKPVFMAVGLFAALSVATLAWYIPKIGSDSQNTDREQSVVVDSNTPPPEQEDPIEEALPVDEMEVAEAEEPTPEEPEETTPPVVAPEQPVRQQPSTPVTPPPTVEAEQPDVDENAERIRQLQRQADQARNQMLTQERLVPGTDEVKQRIPSYNEAIRLKANAERDLASGNYEQAAQVFNEASSLFTAMQGEAVDVLRTDAEQQRTAMNNAQDRISGNHPDVQEFAQAIALQRQANQSYNAQDYEAAAQFYEEAAQLFAQAENAITNLETEVTAKLNVFTEGLKNRISNAYQEQDLSELNTLLSLTADEQEAWRKVFSAFSNFRLTIKNESLNKIRFDRYELEFDTALSYKNNKNRSETQEFMLNGTLDYVNGNWIASPLMLDTDS